MGQQALSDPKKLHNSSSASTASVQTLFSTIPAGSGSESVAFQLLCVEASGNLVRVSPEDSAHFGLGLFIVNLIKNIRVFAT